MSCTAYADLFNKFIAQHISDYLSSYENFVKVMQSDETICTKDIACYIYKTYSKKTIVKSYLTMTMITLRCI